MTRIVRILSAALAISVLAACFTVPSIAAAAQVTVRPARSPKGGEMVAPVISKHGTAPEHRLRQGYEELWGVVEQICDQAGETPIPTNSPEPEEAVTGFTALVSRFNAIRRQLIPLMEHYGLGYPPSLEDFSELGAVYFAPSRLVKVHGASYVEVRADFLEAPACRFELTK